jgi:hypothetical protein
MLTFVSAVDGLRTHVSHWRLGGSLPDECYDLFPPVALRERSTAACECHW